MITTSEFSAASPPQYLAFEGGGGRGAAFLGAINTLEHSQPPIIKYLYPDDRNNRRLDPKRLLGVAGTSAGAITATLLAAGYNTQDLLDFIRSNQFNSVFSDPSISLCPTIVFNQRARYYGSAEALT